MKNNYLRIALTAIMLPSLALVSCQKDKENKEEEVIPESGYVLGFRTGTGVDSENDADYVLTASDLLTGNISATGRGIEQTGWCYYGTAGKTYFTFNYDLNECTGYKFSEGKLTEAGKFVFERMDCMNPGGDANTLVAIGAPWGGGSYDCSIQLISAENISVYKSQKTPIYTSFDSAGTQLNAWPTHSYVQNGKLYVSFYPLNGASWATPLMDTAYVSVYTYPELKFVTTFKDTRTGPIGYYGSQPSIIKDEAGNHYTIATNSKAAGFTQTGKPSGILKINAGAETFADDYFFNVEESGYKVLTAAYAGNGKAVARVISTADDAVATAWAAFSYSGKAICKIAILDLNAKTITIVNDVPAHSGQYQTPFQVEGSTVYMSVNTGVATNIYAIDSKTATAKKGAEVLGREVQAFFKY